ncbi:LPS export ABC transporter periplasmic protein LptC [Maribacter sp. MMG018]|uniref:LPS export ABC transporter periplasmic protein LptC n=1 Tax=Maribacter sp. MMG018 TaxID=2822688 RepID=UPI001B393ECC|nr:LPS export ABC transporter periplasmic protein LptC [Maribacter sp. MMG018]MBQ4912947.1 LPS export ABC transporter periplasmic protein LptC [Maribacter sp. MMG018]
MNKRFLEILKGIAMVFSIAMLFFSCKDNYKRVGEEAKREVFPQGVAENFVLTYTETPEKVVTDGEAASNVLAILSGPLRKDFENLDFPYQTFPEGLLVEVFDEKKQKTTIEADYGIYYASTALIDLQGNVIIKGHDGKKLEAPQLYYDRENEWAFTEEKFKFTNPEDGTVMDGEGMDIKKDLSFLNARKTYGLMLIKEDKDD